MSRAQRTFDAEFNRKKALKSPAYKRGVMDILQTRLDGAPAAASPYLAGSPEADAYLAGASAGERLATSDRSLVSDVRLSDLRSTALQFYELARLSYDLPLNGRITGPFVAQVTCIAFSIELWLKALYCVENPKGKMPWGHHLHKLFNQLSPTLQATLIASSNKAPEAFRSELEKDTKTFETWRYAYEYNAGYVGSSQVLTVNHAMLDELAKSCHRAFDELRPLPSPNVG